MREVKHAAYILSNPLASGVMLMKHCCCSWMRVSQQVQARSLDYASDQRAQVAQCFGDRYEQCERCQYPRPPILGNMNAVGRCLMWAFITNWKPNSSYAAWRLWGGSDHECHRLWCQHSRRFKMCLKWYMAHRCVVQSRDAYHAANKHLICTWGFHIYRNLQSPWMTPRTAALALPLVSPVGVDGALVLGISNSSDGCQPAQALHLSSRSGSHCLSRRNILHKVPRQPQRLCIVSCWIQHACTPPRGFHATLLIAPLMRHRPVMAREFDPHAQAMILS